MKLALGVVLTVGIAIFFVVQTAEAQKAPARSAGRDCQTELKQTDGFRELSAALKCLNDRVKALEASQSAGSSSAPRGTVEAPPPTSERAKHIFNDTLRLELSKCGWQQGGENNLTCEFQVTNLVKEDKRFCFGDASRLVTDKGASFSNSNGFYAYVGSVENYLYKGNNPICDMVPPFSKIQAKLAFRQTRGQADGEIQFLRVDCGSGCVYEAYKIPIK